MAQAGAMVLALGQTLIPRLTIGMDSPSLLIDLDGLSATGYTLHRLS